MDEKEKLYIKILLDSMKKKHLVVSKLYEFTVEQNHMLSQEQLDFDKFEDTISEKEQLISRLQELDGGFSEIYGKIEKSLQQNKQRLRNEIEQLQELITVLTDCGVAIQALERKNSLMFQLKVADKRQEVKSYKQNSRSAASYYSNMANQHQKGSSYFLDQKK